ncbi:fimbrial protein [Photorhabdus tasmaniensis]|uniref:fimbrial protein n=1 Tax=Photorhabdus tasmaniensis TaxID=1004159 RepID=UPI00404184B7
MKHYLIIITIFILINIKDTYARCLLNARQISLDIELNSVNINPNINEKKSILVGEFRPLQLAQLMNINENTPLLNPHNCDPTGEPLIFMGDVYPSKPGNTPHGTGMITTGIDNLYFYLIASGEEENMKLPTTSGSNYIYKYKDGITLKDIGKISVYLYQAGMLPSGQVLRPRKIAILQTFTGTELIRIKTRTNYTIKTQTCSTTTPRPMVDFGRVNSFLFKGIGSTVGNAGFNIEIKCTKNVKPKITFSGERVNYAPDSVIQLNNHNSKNTAKGVGIQILYMGTTPVSLESPLVFGYATANTTYTLPFTARYYQTDEKITGGKANAIAHFTIQYE